MAGVELEYVLPAADLQPFVTLFYRLHVSSETFEDLERAQIAQLRFLLSPCTSCYHFPDGSRQDAPSIHLLGPTTGPTRVCVKGPILGFGMGLTPTGWEAMLGSAASTMVNQVADAVMLLDDAVAETAVALRADGGAAAMAAAATPLVRRLMRGGGATTQAFVRAVDAWLSGSPSPQLSALVAATGLSRRQVERRCNALYGAPPKLLARKYRALRAAVALASGETAVEGFYDQSHMIREVKEFTGLTPGRLREDPGALARITIAQRRALVGLVHPIISET